MNNENELIYQKVRHILLHEWDPIGVGDLAEAQDEYDSYVQPVCNLIKDKKEFIEIYEYLNWVVHDYMCLDDNDDINLIVAKKLAKLSIVH